MDGLLRMARQLELFKEIWSERDHISFLSGKPLKYFDVKYMAHVLPKGKYTKYKYLKENIILLTPEEHNLLDQGTEKQRLEYAKKNNCDWNIVYNLKEKLKKRYVDK